MVIKGSWGGVQFLSFKVFFMGSLLKAPSSDVRRISGAFEAQTHLNVADCP